MSVLEENDDKAISKRQKITEWYSNKGSLVAHDVLQNAFGDAQRTLVSLLTDEECSELGARDDWSIGDVEAALRLAQKAHQNKPTSKARKWLVLFSARVHHYASVLDVLIQHHPQYVSLAWGAMRVLFQSVINHEENARELSKAFSRIADILPRTELSLSLYPTERFHMAVANLYAHILKFIIKGLRWFKQGKCAHIWGSIAKPWALDFEEDVEKIQECSRYLEQNACAAARAELRDAHLKITKLEGMMQQIANAIEQEGKFRADDASTQLSLQKEVILDLRNQKNVLREVQVAQIISLHFMRFMPTSGECLSYCRSVSRRHGQRYKAIVPELGILQRWASEPKTSYIVTQSGHPQSAKDFAVEVVTLIRQSSMPLLWALRFPNYWETELRCVHILKSLVLQAVQLNPSALVEGKHPLSSAHMHDAVDDEDWFRILNEAIRGLPYVYIVIDAELLNLATSHNKAAASRWMHNMQRTLTATYVKVFVSAYSIDKSYAAFHWEPEHWLALQTDAIPRGLQGRRRRLSRAIGSDRRNKLRGSRR